MRRLCLSLTPTSAAVFSASAATVGGHLGLDYVPGSALLGYAAGRLYEAERIDAFELFHSGAVRFLNAYPLCSAGGRSFPLPLSLQQSKTARDGVRRDGTLVSERIRNTIFDQGAGDAPLDALPARFITPEGMSVNPRHDYRMKTAISEGERRAEEAQLFGYDALRAGDARFYGEVHLDDDVDEAVIARLSKAFGGQVRLGRSAAAEFGGNYEVERIDADEVADPRVWPASDRVTLWCISDIVLEDHNGAPVTEPSPECLGFGPGRFVAESSIVRTRRWSPWNRKLGRRESERLAIRAGSVLSLELQSSEATSHLSRGVGRFREQGLGQVWVNPAILAAGQPAFGGGSTTVETHSKPGSGRPDIDDPLSAALVAHATTREDIRAAEFRLETTAGQWVEKLRKIRTERPISPTQWSRVAREAMRHGSAKDRLIAALFTDKNAICAASDPSWKSVQRDFHDLVAKAPQADVGHIIGLTARMMRTKAQSGGEGRS